MPVWTTVIHIQPFRQTAALDGRAQHVLAGARVLVGDPAAVDEQPRVIVDQHEEVGALATAGTGRGNEWTNQHVADPHLIRSVSLEATESTWLTGQRRPLEATALEMLANGALGDADAMAGKEDGPDLGGRAGGQLDPQGADLVKELRVAADRAQVSAWVGLEAIQALLAIGADPAVERAARVLTLAAIGMLVQLARQLAHQPSAVGWTEPRTDGFGDDTVTEQRGGFGGLGGHGAGPPSRDGAIQSAPAPRAQGEVVWVPSAWPPLIRLQNAHTSPMRTPNRTTARCQATPRLASAAGSPTAWTLTGVPSRATASAVH